MERIYYKIFKDDEFYTWDTVIQTLKISKMLMKEMDIR